MPVFCSDPLSSVAYATEETLLILSLAGAALLHLAWYVAAAIVGLLVIVIASYRQTCHAYPNGGGAYTVASANLGRNAGLAAASALLVDYVLTVAVSVVAGVAAITSAFPGLAPHAVSLSVGFVVVLTLVNLRGVKESGRAFAAPTYAFLVGIFLMFAVAGYRMLTGEQLQASTASLPIHPEHSYAGLAVLVLAMRAFASGCTALTGVEAISNGVPAFEKPKSRNAANTLAIMGALSITMFVGITALALTLHVHVAASPTDLGLPADAATQTVLAQIAQTVFGNGVFFYFVQAGTAAILILAANTAYNGFPLLASLLASDRFLPAPTAQPRRPPGLQQRDRPAGRLRRGTHRRLQRKRQFHHPALHHRSLPLLHAVPSRHGAPLATRIVSQAAWCLPQPHEAGPSHQRGRSTRDRGGSRYRRRSRSSPTGPGSSLSPCPCSS